MRTFQRCTRSLPWKSKRGTWTAVWRRTPCGCCPTPQGCWPCSRAAADWPEGSRPGSHTNAHLQLRLLSQICVKKQKGGIQMWGCTSLPDGSCRRTSRSWWKRPRVSASRYCSWTSSGGNLTVGSLGTETKQTLFTDWCTKSELYWNIHY